MRNPQIVALAVALQRTAGSVALKLANLAALGESLPRKGMSNASGVDRRVWAEFLKNPGRVLSAYAVQTGSVPRPAEGFAERQADFEAKQGERRQSLVTVRIGQSFFREMIVASYGRRCALTGIEDQRLLNASHIVGWADAPDLRLNPANGICLNALHDRAFDRHLITFDEDYRMMVRNDVKGEARRSLERVETTRLTMPARFLPDQAFLERHRRLFRAAAA